VIKRHIHPNLDWTSGLDQILRDQDDRIEKTGKRNSMRTLGKNEDGKAPVIELNQAFPLASGCEKQSTEYDAQAAEDRETEPCKDRGGKNET
jgi:hypothetical protein